MKRSACALLLVFVVGAPCLAGADVVSVTLNPTSVAGGSGRTSLGTVTIASPAPAGGRVINLTSSNTDLASSTERIVVPAGATSATFTVGTNSLYRPYSGLAFNVSITATDAADGTSASATLNVTARPIPGPFTGGTVSTQANATAGRMCGGSFGTGDAKERGILYRCEFPEPGQFSVCTFQQECTFGCQTQAAPNLNRNDVCTTAPPFPLALNPERLEGGRRSNGTVFLSAPADSFTQANINSSPIGEISPLGGFGFPTGATSGPFWVDTFEVAVPAFVQVRGDIALNSQSRFAQDYLAVVPAPGTGPVSGPLGVFSVDATPMAVVQGNPSIGVVVLSGVATTDTVVSLSSSDAAAEVPPTVTVDAGQTATSFGITTNVVSASTPVTITATLGATSRTTQLTVSPFIFSSTMPALSTLTLTPSTVDAGARSVGRITMNGPAPDPSDGPVTVSLTSSNESAVVVSRTATVGFGGTFQDFRIRTFAVAAQTLVTITATFNGVSRSATLTVNPSGSTPPPLALSSISVNPTTVQGGNPSTGTATLNQAAPPGGVSVALFSDNTVAVVPASVTVPAGQASANFTVTTSAVAASTTATITGTFNGVSRTATLTVNPAPPPGPLPAPSLLSPPNNARFSAGATITFDWSDVAGAASYTIQIDDSQQFSTPLIQQQTTTASQHSTNTLPTRRMWWRVRANDASGAPGAWSAVRRFEVKN